MPTQTKSKTDLLSVAVKEQNQQLFAALALHRTHRGEKLSFREFPSLRALYAEKRRKGCVIKSTQGGVSEFLLVKGVSEASGARNVFWVLPTYSLVARFVRERFDRTMAATPAYRRLVGEVDSSRFADSVSMKQFGKGTIALVGSNTAAAFTEFPADTLIVDELDQCDQANVVMAWERLSASKDPSEWYVSNPTITSFGIDNKYAESTQGLWHVRCPGCSQYIHPQFIGNVVRQVGKSDYLVMDSDYERGREPRCICHHCGAPFDPRSEGIWIERYPSRAIAGYHYNKLFTARVPLSALLERFEKSEGDETLRQRVWNADFGLAYNAPGARLQRQDIIDAIGGFKKAGELPRGAVVMGIDVGGTFHISVGVVRYGDDPMVYYDWFTERDSEEVITIVKRLNPVALVIDALPETRESRRIAASTRGGFVCYFGGKKNETVSKGAVTVDRTSLLDSVRAAVVTKAIEFPVGTEEDGEFVAQMTASTRTFDPDGNRGEGAYVWQEGSKPDHYFLSTAYMVLAARLIVSAEGR